MEITDLPAFNQLCEDCEKYLAGHLEGEAMGRSLAHLEETLDAMYFHFYDTLQYQEDDPLLDEVVPECYSRFQVLKQLWEPLAAALEGMRAEEARSVLERGAAALHELYAGFARLKEHAQSRPRYSDIPAVDEMVRVAQVFMRGGLPEEALQRRTAQFLQFHSSLVQGLASLEPSGPERRVFDPEEMTGALEQSEHGVELLQQAMDQQDPELLDEAVGLLCRAAERLVAMQKGLLEAQLADETLPCPRCSAENPLGARYCGGCQAILPAAVSSEGQRVLAEEGAGPSQELPENLLILSEAVEQMREGRIDPREFGKTLEWLDGNLQKGAEMLAAQEPPPAETPPDQMAAYRGAVEAMQAGMEDFAAGLEMLASFLDRPDPGRLDHGMDLARRGAMRMLEVERIWADISGGADPAPDNASPVY